MVHGFVSELSLIDWASCLLHFVSGQLNIFMSDIFKTGLVGNIAKVDLMLSYQSFDQLGRTWDHALEALASTNCLRRGLLLYRSRPRVGRVGLFFINFEWVESISATVRECKMVVLDLTPLVNFNRLVITLDRHGGRWIHSLVVDERCCRLWVQDSTFTRCAVDVGWFATVYSWY